MTGGELNEVFLHGQLAATARQVRTLSDQMERIRRSRAWRLASMIRAARCRLAPEGCLRDSAVRGALRALAGITRLADRLRRVWAPRTRGEAGLGCSDGLPADGYDLWIAWNEPAARELEEQRREDFEYRPRISVVVPMCDPPLPFLEAMLESVREQTYGCWELCVAGGGNSDEEARQFLAAAERAEPRVRVKVLDVNRGVAGNTNAALGMATGEFVTFLDHDDTLAPFALFEVVRALNAYPDADLLYSDEDRVTADGKHRLPPYFKPAWSPDLLRCTNYVGRLAVYRRSLLTEVGGLREGFGGAQDHDLALRFTERTQRVVHIPKVLYHSRVQPGSASSDSANKAAGLRAVEDHHRRCGRIAQVRPSRFAGIYKSTFTLPRHPLVSLVIPNRDQAASLRRCLDSIKKSNYPHYEIVVVENGSREPGTHAYYDELRTRPNVKIVNFDGAFNFAAAVNLGVKHAAGEVVLLLNNDTEAINPDWLERMVEHAVRPEVGAVGAKLYYGNGTLQHAGVVVGAGGRAEYVHPQFPGDYPGYGGRLLAVHNLSAVTGACLMARKAVYEEVGGFEEAFALAYNDIDFCLKLRRKGYLVVWTPLAELYHHESLTRGLEDTSEKRRRFDAETALLRRRWVEFFHAGDPYYSPHFNPDNAEFQMELRIGTPRPAAARAADARSPAKARTAAA